MGKGIAVFDPKGRRNTLKYYFDISDTHEGYYGSRPVPIWQMNVPIFDDITEFVIPEAMWVVFENDGLFKEDVQSVFHRFLTEFLPFSGYEYAGLPDIEIYPISEGRPTKGHSEVWIAIKKTKES